MRTLQSQPDAEGRVAELAVPLGAALEGNLAPLWENTIITLSMFHSRGDPEWLYNIADRPVFGPITAFVFWLGVVVCVVQVWRSFKRQGDQTDRYAYGFLLLWWLAGISPAFLSLPPASLSHTILAQPATYLLLAIPITGITMLFEGWQAKVAPLITQEQMVTALVALLILLVAIRDLPDYFVEWPNRGFVRFLYHADTQDIAQALSQMPELDDFSVTSLLAGPWNRLAPRH